MDIPRREKWHTKVPLGIRRCTVKNSPDNSHSVKTEGRANRTTWWTVRGHLGVSKTLDSFRQQYFDSMKRIVLRSNAGSATPVQLAANFFCRYGEPRELHSDQGRNFDSRL